MANKSGSSAMGQGWHRPPRRAQTMPPAAGVTRRGVIAAPAAIPLAAWSAACGPFCQAPGETAPPRPQQLSGTISVSYWASGEQGQLWLKHIDNFAKRYPQVRTEPIHLAPYAEKLTTLIASDTPPDVIGLQSVQGQVAALGGSGALLDLGPYVRRDSREVDEGDFWPAVRALSRHEGKQVTLPQGNATPALLFYNADLFHNASIKTPAEQYDAKQWTWEAYRDAAIRLTKRSGDTVEQFGAELPPNMFWALPYLWIFGGDVLTQDLRKAAVDLPKSIDALQRLADQHQRDRSVWVPGVPELRGFLDWERPGKMGMAPSWDARTAIWRQQAFRWDIAPLPRGPAGEVTVLQINAHGVARQSRVPELAWTFAKYWVSKDGGMERLLDFGIYPARKSLADPWKQAMARLAPPSNLKYFDLLAKIARPVPAIAQLGRIADLWVRHATPIYLGKVTAREGAEGMAREINEILAGG